MPMRRTALLALSALALIASACSDSGGGTTTSSAGPSTTSSTTATTAPPTTAAASTTTVASTTTGPPVSTTTSLPVPLADITLSLAEVAAGFTQPVFVTAPPGDERLFVVQQDGRIETLRGGERLGTFLDLSDLVSFGGEQGLLGLAFHPDYPANGRFYVAYTDRRGDSVLAEYRVSGDPDRADRDSGRVLLMVEQPAANHNGGMIAFGPDGFLYVGMGDGGGAGDPYGTGQDPGSRLGSILRLDVAGDPYGIPPDNPYADGGGAAEVWAKGLRNPWRFSFDSGLIYIADVGQNSWEEVNVADAGVPGHNFGWPIMEGAHCFRADDCDRTGLILPLLEYGHAGGDCSVTGGYVYRGAAIPELAGAYFYGDFCSGRIASLRADPGGIREQRDWSDSLGRVAGLTSFGLDGAGEIYLTSQAGTVYRLERG